MKLLFVILVAAIPIGRLWPGTAWTPTPPFPGPPRRVFSARLFS